MKQTKAAVVHTVFTALLLALAAVSAALLVTMNIEMLSIMAQPPAEGSEGFGQGLGLAVGAVLAIIFSISTAALSVVGIAVSAPAVRIRYGGVKIFSIIALIFEIFFIVLSVTSVIFVAVGL